MTQWQYTGIQINTTSGGYEYGKQMSYMFYDYNKVSYRDDYHVVRGEPKVNSTSIWIEDTLYLINYLTDPFECNVLNMGFARYCSLISLHAIILLGKAKGRIK